MFLYFFVLKFVTVANKFVYYNKQYWILKFHVSQNIASDMLQTAKKETAILF